MDGLITVRFHEHEYYDIQTDETVVIFMATTGEGSYFAEMVPSSAKTLREARKEFKDAAMDLIQNGQSPCELTFETVH